MKLEDILRKSITHYNKSDSSQIAAALSYYSLFAIAPILFILLSILGLFLSDIQTQNTILTEIYTIFPTDIAFVIGNIIHNIVVNKNPTSISGVIGIIILIISSTTIVRKLQDALNAIFETTNPNKVTLSQRFKKRILAFALLLVLGLLLLFSFILNALLNALGQYISAYVGFDSFLLYILNIAVSLITVSTLFSLLFKYLPDRNLPIKTLLIGGFITGMLFTIGKNIIGYVLGHADFGSLYGTAGTILIFLFWVYYTSIIFLYGASLTYIISQKHTD